MTTTRRCPKVVRSWPPPGGLTADLCAGIVRLWWSGYTDRHVGQVPRAAGKSNRGSIMIKHVLSFLTVVLTASGIHAQTVAPELAAPIKNEF